MKFKLLSIAATAILAAATSTSYAVPSCALGAGNLGLTSVSCSVVGGVITIEETFGSAQMGSIVLTGLDAGVDYTVRKVITNSSGVDFTRIANELLDPAGQANDTTFDVLPYPSFVPVGFTTSNDNDGLSFAQGSGIPRTSSVFATVVADEATDVRDFLDFSGGTLANGATDNFMTFGLRDSNPADNQPFLLIERPNRSSVVSEPTSLLLMSAALLALGASRRRRT